MTPAQHGNWRMNEMKQETLTGTPQEVDQATAEVAAAAIEPRDRKPIARSR